MLTVDQLWTLLDELAATPLPVEHICLTTALGRVLRAPVLADVDQPAFDRSAFDGYLVALDQTPGEVSLLGAIEPGTPAPTIPPARGEAWRIFTGSAVTVGDVGIVMQEDTVALADGRVQINVVPQTSFIRRRGSQCHAGDTLLAANQTLGPGHLALLATVGLTRPEVTRRVRVAHLATGAELVAPDVTPGPGQIRDSNSTLIAALIAATGAELVWQHRVSDDRGQTLHAINEALAFEPDVLLVGGGASVGAHDHTAALLREVGFTVHSEKVASRPGKPFIVASCGATIACGLPGNPLSHLVCYHLFVRRLIDRLHGLPPTQMVTAQLVANPALRIDSRETWWPASLHNGIVTPLPWRDSSDLTVLAAANTLLRIPAGTAPTSPVEVLPLF